MFDCMHLCFIPCFESVYCLKDRSMPSVVAQRDVVGTKGYAWISRFSDEVCGALLLIFIGGSVWNVLHGLWCLDQIPQGVAIPLELFAAVGITNLINLIDGIDGLASGLCSIACLFYGVTFLMLNLYIYAMLAFATLDVFVPFFYYNVFGNAEHGKKIFMGDTGSLTVGMMLYFLSLKLAKCRQDGNTGNVHSTVLAFSLLLVPCCDVVRVYLHRVRNGKKFPAGQEPYPSQVARHSDNHCIRVKCVYTV